MKAINALLIFGLLIAGPVWANNDDHSRSVEDVLQEIRLDLGLSADDAIDPDEVSAALLEELGEAVMSAAHPDAEVHEFMDQMMGGEGSESLASAHRWMGYRLLTGGYGRFGGPMMGMMGMMGGRGFGGWGMMGADNVPYASIPYESPEDIIKRRYASGEISRSEYLQMMEDIGADE